MNKHFILTFLTIVLLSFGVVSGAPIINSPTNTTYSYTSVAFNITVTENTSIVYDIDSSLKLLLSCESINGTNYTIDRSGNNNDAEAKNLANITADKFGNACLFNGIDSIFDAGNDSSLDITGNLSINALINPYDWGEAGEGRIVEKRIAGSIPWISDLYNTRFRLHVAGVQHTSDTFALSLNTRQRIGIAYDSNNVRFYVDGMNRGTVAETGAIISNIGIPVTIGNEAPLGRAFNGTIDEISIQNRNKSLDEYSCQYNLSTSDASTCSFNETFSEGSHTITIYTINETGNPTSQIITFAIDLTVPVVTPNNMDGIIIIDNTPDFNVTAIDNTDLNGGAELFINGTGYGLNSSALINNTPFIITANTSLADGYWEWYVTVIDSAGNKNKSITRNFIIDTSAPVVTPNNMDGIIIIDNTPDFIVTAIDNTNLNGGAELFINGIGYGLNTSPLANNTPFIITANTSLNNGYWEWYINVTDEAGNTGKSVTRNVTVNILDLPNIQTDFNFNGLNIVVLYILIITGLVAFILGIAYNSWIKTLFLSVIILLICVVMLNNQFYKIVQNSETFFSEENCVLALTSNYCSTIRANSTTALTYTRAIINIPNNLIYIYLFMGVLLIAKVILIYKESINRKNN